MVKPKLRYQPTPWLTALKDLLYKRAKRLIGLIAKPDKPIRHTPMTVQNGASQPSVLFLPQLDLDQNTMPYIHH